MFYFKFSKLPVSCNIFRTLRLIIHCEKILSKRGLRSEGDSFYERDHYLSRSCGYVIPMKWYYVHNTSTIGIKVIQEPFTVVGSTLLNS